MCRVARGAASALKSQVRVGLRRPGRAPDPPLPRKTPRPPKREKSTWPWPAEWSHGANGGGLSSSSGACVALPAAWRRQMSSREKKVVVAMFRSDDAPGIPHEDGARDEA